MNIFNNHIFKDDIEKVVSLNISWDKLRNRSVLISGATGLIGAFLVDVIMACNFKKDLNCKIYALGRNIDKAYDRFKSFLPYDLFKFITHDINLPLNIDGIGKIDYAIHLASNTHPLAYSKDPIGTITTNIIGVKNMLDFCVNNEVSRFAFASSNEIYGENRGDVEKFTEDYCGYINCNTMRAGYPESKRCGEALCQAYIKQKNLDIVIPRLTRSYGATMLMNDSKAVSQFINKAITGQNIVLKSKGNQYYSFTYVADAVSGLLTVFLKGKCGEAYNIADNNSDIRLKDLAELIAKKAGVKVVYEIPSEMEKAGYSTATVARLEDSKIKELGWRAEYTIDEGIQNTISILRSQNANSGDEI